MGLLDKVKNFFYDDEDELEETREIPIKYSSEKKEIKVEEVPERELFKAERTFNFPMDFDEETKTNIRVESIKKEEINNNNINNESNSYNTFRTNKSNDDYKRTTENRYSNMRSYTKIEEKKDEKKFRPTPVISPIYGVLDKNYKKEDIAIDATQEFNIPKKLDYDTIRKRAYGNMYGPTKEESDDTKGIFYNLDEEKQEEFNSDEDVKIIYNDVTFDDDSNSDDDFITPSIVINEEISKMNEEESDENILSETKEQDLFNLIDNMYNSDEEDEEEE